MSTILKQMEESRLTPEEVQELITLLSAVLPKIGSKIKHAKSLANLSKNLSAGFSKNLSTSIEAPNIKDESLALIDGFDKLTSAKNKLVLFTDSIKDI